MAVVLDLAFEVDLLGDVGPSQRADSLFYLSKEAFKRRLIDDLWRAKAATSPKSLASVIMSDVVMEHIRKELRRQTGHQVDPANLAELIRKNVLGPEILQ